VDLTTPEYPKSQVAFQFATKMQRHKE